MKQGDKLLCFGAYENESKCESCPLALICIEKTIENDGYYDKLAEEEQRWQEMIADWEEASLMSALFADEKQ